VEKGKSSQRQTGTLYGEVTDRIIAQLEAGRVPWVQPWDGAKVSVGMPRNAGTGRRYSGINVLILWARLFERGFASQGWLTYRQALALGGNVRKGETGATVCYADRFTPKGGAGEERGDGDARQIAFLKRFTVFNVDQCESLPADVAGIATPLGEREIVPAAEALMVASGARISIGGGEAYYMPALDRIQPTVRHADYLACWLSVLRDDSRAIFRAASAASKAADYLLAFRPTTESNEMEAGQ
jgi:antirestriction protein ArdC